jgi:hypothetical protein
MAERKTKFRLGDKEVDAWEVPVDESTERWTELKLEDGAVLRIKAVVSNVYRLANEKDQEGRPIYGVNSSFAVVTVEGPKKIAERKVQ